MVPNITLFLIFVTITSVTAQTFQYSRGWTNGKRAGRPDVTNWTNGRRDNHDVTAWANSKRERSDNVRDFTSNLEKVLNPCQMNKLKYLLEGKALSESFFLPCDYPEDEETQPKRTKNDFRHTSSDLFETFQ